MALRKMLGDIHSSECESLMRIIETQSQKTLAAWAISYAKERYLPILGEEQAAFAQTIHQCERYLCGEIKLAECKPYLKEARTLAAGIKNPTMQATARAVSTACAVVTTPTNALGYLFYGAAAVAYHTAGEKESADTYNALAAKELQNACESLKNAAVENEPNPAKINWNC